MFLDLTGESVALLTLVALLAGVVDAIVGGGGLLQLPFLLAVLPGFGPATPLGVNKAVSALGNLASAAVYRRRNPGARVDGRLLAWAGAVAVAGAVTGALVAASLSVRTLRPVVIAVLVTVLWLVVSGRLARAAEAQPVAPRAPGPPAARRLLLGDRPVRRRRRPRDGELPAPGAPARPGPLAGRLPRHGEGRPVLHEPRRRGRPALRRAHQLAADRPARPGEHRRSALGARLTLRRGDAFVRAVLVLAVLAATGKLVHDQWF
ncbi:TSUP family transporter [Streptomyces somaliensis]|nr:TSUP family transporter [Streptomyces somaliensis]